MWFSNPRFGREIFDYSIPNRKIFRILRRGSPNSLPARFPIFENFWEFWEILEKPKKRDGPQKRDSDQKQENHQNVMMNDPGRNFWNSRNSNREFLDNDLAVSRGISQRAAKFLDTQYKAKMDHLRELYPYHYPQPRYNAILPRILWRDPRLVRAPFDIFQFLLVLVRCSRILSKFWWS